MKTSTTWLYAQLRNHPDVWLSPIKELQALDYLGENVDTPTPLQVQGYQRKLSGLQSNIQSVLRKDTISRTDISHLKLLADAALAEEFNFEWYASFFDQAPEDKTIVEVAPTYAYASEQNVKSFSEFLGQNVSVVFVLRNPVGRWLSQGRFDLRVTLQKDLDDETLPVMAELMSKKWKKVGGYKEYIEVWERHFSNISFVFQDDLHASNGLEQVCGLLGVPWNDSWFSDRDARVNSQGDYEFPMALRSWVAAERMDELNWLAERFGERTLIWRDEAQKVAGS